MEKIKIKIENQFGEVYFETTQQKIDEFNEDYMMEFEEFSEEDDFTIDVRTLGTDAYVFFENEGKFILIQEYTLTDETTGDYIQGFSLIFQNCTCPAELEKSIQNSAACLTYIINQNEIWFGYDNYGDENDEEIDDSKFQEIVEKAMSGYYGDTGYSRYIEREGVIRYEEWKSILDLGIE